MMNKETLNHLSTPELLTSPYRYHHIEFSAKDSKLYVEWSEYHDVDDDGYVDITRHVVTLSGKMVQANMSLIDLCNVWEEIYPFVQSSSVYQYGSKPAVGIDDDVEEPNFHGFHSALKYFKTQGLIETSS